MTAASHKYSNEVYGYKKPKMVNNCKFVIKIAYYLNPHILSLARINQTDFTLESSIGLEISVAPKI